MSTPVALAPARSTHLGRSVVVVTAALVANIVLSLGADQAFHALDVYPPWGQPMHEPELNVVALSYRLVFGVASGWIVALLAPGAPKRHALILGAIATTLGALGVLGAAQVELGPLWYPVALMISAYPTVRLGAILHERRARRA